MKKKSLLDNIVTISKKVKDLNYTIIIDKDLKEAKLLVCDSLLHEELESISSYCVSNDINWLISIENANLVIKIWEDAK